MDLDVKTVSPGANRSLGRPNGYAERFVLTARTELTDRVLILSQRHLHAVLAEYVRHYNGRRPHRPRELSPPRPTHPAADLNSQRIKPPGRRAGFARRSRPGRCRRRRVWR